MTDLINKVDEIGKKNLQELQNIVNQFSTVLHDTKEKDIPYVAYIIHLATNYININYKDLSKDWKTWSVFFIRHQYLKGKLTKLSDIPILIDKFLEFYNTEYDKYCNDIFAATDYDRDRGFINYYEKKINDGKI